MNREQELKKRIKQRENIYCQFPSTKEEAEKNRENTIAIGELKAELKGYQQAFSECKSKNLDQKEKLKQKLKESIEEKAFWCDSRPKVTRSISVECLNKIIDKIFKDNLLQDTQSQKVSENKESGK